MISVVIPTCDRPVELLNDAIQSVVKQSLPAHEIIIADNGREPVNKELIPFDVSVYRLPPRIGPSRARNFGAAMAKGNLIAFLDDDDFWHPDFLKNAMTVLKDSKADCVYGRINVLRKGEERPHAIPTNETVTIPILLQKNPGTGGINFLVSKEVYWRAGGFDERLLVSEDRGFAIEVLRTGGKISVAPQAVTIMREHENARQRQNDLKRFSFIAKYRRELGFIEFSKRSVWIVSKAIRRRIRSTLRK